MLSWPVFTQMASITGEVKIQECFWEVGNVNLMTNEFS